MSDVKVSIIIPVYNPGNLLINCLNSVKDQTLQEIEVLCIDDGSTDNSLEILNDYSNKDSRFKIFTQKNQGAGFARNVGINNAGGEFIIFLDSDDWIESDMCEILYNQAKSLGVDLMLFNSIRHLEDNKTRDLIHFDNNFNENYKKFTFNYKYIKDKVMNGYFGVIWTKFYKTSFIKENDIFFTQHKMFNDVEYHIKSLLLAKSIAYCPKVLHHYMMIGQPSLQSSYTGSYDSICFYDVMVGVREFLISHDFMDEFRIEFLNYSFFYFKSKLNVMDSKYKSEYFSKIKSFFETTNITFSELKKINPIYVNFYLHLINSSSYDQFEFLNSHYDERLMSVIDLDYLPIEFDEFIENSFENTNCYINVLENNVLKLNEELESSKRDVVNLKSKANKLNEKEILINDLNGDLKILKQDIANLKLEIEELSFSKIKLENEIKYLKNNNYNLSVENKKLKQEIDEIKSSKLWKLKNM